jgi:hypothetical protein
MRHAHIPALLVVVAALSGCAHAMLVTPEVERLAPSATASRIPVNVGLYISPENRGKQVTTPGGGGDKVSYHPYADMETGLYKVLGNVFQDVTILKSARDTDTLAKKSIVYVVQPEITTSSSSSGLFTWMATDFQVQLDCKITDAQGAAVTDVTVNGAGHAVFDELKSNFSLAGQRASTDALQKAQAALLAAPRLKK